MIHLTRAGKALRKPLSDASEAQVAMLIDCLGQEAFDQLTRTLLEANEILRTNGISRPDF
jgi:DNA-binding MarR family transcriptional regulator